MIKKLLKKLLQPIKNKIITKLPNLKLSDPDKKWFGAINESNHVGVKKANDHEDGGAPINQSKIFSPEREKREDISGAFSPIGGKIVTFSLIEGNEIGK